MTWKLAENTITGPPVSALVIPDGRVLEALEGRGVAERLSFAWPCLAATLSGLMMAGCYAPFDVPWLAWVALVPWLVVLPRVSARGAWLYGTVFGLVFYRIGLAWFFSVIGPMAGVVIVGLAVWMGLAFRVARLLTDRFSPAAMMWGVPVALLGQDILRCEGLPQLRFPFLALGYSQSHNHWIAQIASIGGVHAISFLIVLVNAAIAWGVTRWCWRGFLPAIASISAVIALAAAAQPRDYSRFPRLSAACIQAANQSPERVRDLTRQAVDDPSRPRLLVLPEHTIAGYATESHPLVHALANMARTCRAIICVGAHTKAPRDAVCDYNNVSMLIGSDGQVIGEQPKLVPLPFFRDGVPGRSQSQSVTPTEYGTVGTYVCYDGLFSDIPRRVVDAGAEVLLVPNMDEERWPAQERRQHADMAPFRSIELRRCAVRANGAGISQIVDATGRVTACRTHGDGSGIVLGDVYVVSERTPFVLAGHFFAPAVGIAFLAIAGWLTFSGWRARGRSPVPPS
jgi:apolipoprotein N-acyltransferase